MQNNFSQKVHINSWYCYASEFHSMDYSVFSQTNAPRTNFWSEFDRVFAVLSSFFLAFFHFFHNSLRHSKRGVILSHAFFILSGEIGMRIHSSFIYPP